MSNSFLMELSFSIFVNSNVSIFINSNAILFSVTRLREYEIEDDKSIRRGPGASRIHFVIIEMARKSQSRTSVYYIQAYGLRMLQFLIVLELNYVVKIRFYNFWLSAWIDVDSGFKLCIQICVSHSEIYAFIFSFSYHLHRL